MSSVNEIVKRLRESRLEEAKVKYSELDHDDLIDMAQEGDQRAFEELVRQYSPLIDKQSRRYFLDNGTGDKEDIKQIATIAFWEAVSAYDPTIHKHGFGAFASLIISRKLTDALRKEDADVRKINNLANSLDDTVSDDEGDKGTVGDKVASKDLSPEEQFLGREGAKELMKYMRDKFSERERDVVMRHIKGDKIPQIAEETGMSYKSVENTLMRIKNKLTDYLRSSKRESKKVVREEILFSDTEKKILESVIDKVNLQESLKVSTYKQLKDKYEQYTDEQIEDELYDLEEELNELIEEIAVAYDREELLDKVEDIKEKLLVLEDYVPDHLVDKREELSTIANNADETQYEGPAVRHDPWNGSGMSQSDFV